MRLTQRITNLSKQIPVEFQRQMLQSLDMVSKWEATEYELFLLYSGPFVFKDLLPNEYYDHFSLFHVAIRVLCN